MTAPIEAVLFDVNGTLRSSVPSSESRKREKTEQILGLVGGTTSFEDFSALLTARMYAYRCWARDNRIELSESQLWTRWMLPDYPAEHVQKHAVQLNQLWRESTAVRSMFPEAKAVLLELFRRGYRLGIVSNTLSTVEFPTALRALEIRGIFETVVLSCQAGIRKPDPAILRQAAAHLGVEPGKCAYVGNRCDRDVMAAREAGFSKALIIRNSHTHAEQDTASGATAADHAISSLHELLGVFPPRSSRPDVQATYDASCSTMWARHNFPGLPDFFLSAGCLGFAQVELNHQVNSAMLKGLDLSRWPFSSVHEPCPADIPVDELKSRDWLISSTNEDCRRHGVESIKPSIELAAQLGASLVVVHAGMVSTDMGLEQGLHRLFDAGQTASDEYHTLQAEMTELRRRLAPGNLQAVKKSLGELLDYAGRFGIRLGLENRFHYYDIPSLDEMGELLGLADAGRLGFVYDVGHAQHLDRLGFYAHEDWLLRYSTRIIEVHLHDVKGINDHRSPGLGEVDFDMVAAYLPENAIRTLELQPTNTPEEVKAGLKYLAEHSCIKSIEN